MESIKQKATVIGTGNTGGAIARGPACATYGLPLKELPGFASSLIRGLKAGK